MGFDIRFALPLLINIAFAVVVLVVGLFINKWIAKKVGKMIEKRELDATLKQFAQSGVRVLLNIVLIVAIISILGIDTSAFVAMLAAAGFAVGLAFQGSLSNFAGGVLLLITRPFKVGNFIEANGYSGTVEAIQILYTDLVTPDNKVVRIPNGSLSNASVINYSVKETRRVDFQFGVGYEADSSKVIGVLSDIVAQHPLTLQDPQPFVRMSEHGDSAVVYTVRVWVKAPDYWGVYFDVIESVKRSFDKEGISIPYPQMDLHINQSN